MAEDRLEEIRSQRLLKRQALIDANLAPYPSEVRRTHTLGVIQETFSSIVDDQTPIVVLGRLVSLRRHGGLVFADIADESGKLQLQFTRDDMEESMFARLQSCDAGDFVQATGEAIVTQRGVNTLKVSEFHVVSKAIRPLPDTWYGLKDHELRYRQREVDLAINDDVRNLFRIRGQATNWIRNYLSEKSFLEVETPILQPLAGGTLAKPFETHHNALDMELYLRIAPELYLKRLIVGGYEKVFEIGKNFRNEGISKEHNPEFTMLEFYWAYADYEDLMDLTDEMLEGLVLATKGSTTVTWQEHELTFEPPIPRRRYVDLVSEFVGFNILDEKEPAKFIEVFKKEGIEIPKGHSYAKLVDELYKEKIRPSLIQPTIVYDYPVEMAPLAKQNLTDPRIAEMFQLVVGGMEIIKAYTELNDPVEQRKRFEQQQANRKAGDEEAHAIDESYLRAMEYGMPPVAGFGMGIDRLVMLLTDSPNLRDTILFPLLRPESND